MQFFAQSVNIPGLTVSPTSQPTMFITAPVPGDRLVYEQLKVSFLLDEPLLTWSSIVDWIKGISFPENFGQYANLPKQQQIQIAAAMKQNKAQYSDVKLTVMTNKNNPILSISFTDVFPIGLSGFTLDNTENAQSIKTAEATFWFTNYDYNRVV
jgi:hypothetical protein